jgi:hypothetical protein
MSPTTPMTIEEYKQEQERLHSGYVEPKRKTNLQPKKKKRKK